LFLELWSPGHGNLLKDNQEEDIWVSREAFTPVAAAATWCIVVMKLEEDPSVCMSWPWLRLPAEILDLREFFVIHVVL
jgi:hypothetical protein